MLLHTYLSGTMWASSGKLHSGKSFIYILLLWWIDLDFFMLKLKSSSILIGGRQLLQLDCSLKLHDNDLENPYGRGTYQLWMQQIINALIVNIPVHLCFEIVGQEGAAVKFFWFNSLDKNLPTNLFLLKVKTKIMS